MSSWMFHFLIRMARINAAKSASNHAQFIFIPANANCSVDYLRTLPTQGLHLHSINRDGIYTALTTRQGLEKHRCGFYSFQVPGNPRWRKKTMLLDCDSYISYWVSNAFHYFFTVQRRKKKKNIPGWISKPVKVFSENWRGRRRWRMEDGLYRCNPGDSMHTEPLSDPAWHSAPSALSPCLRLKSIQYGVAGRGQLHSGCCTLTNTAYTGLDTEQCQTSSCITMSQPGALLPWWCAVE